MDSVYYKELQYICRTNKTIMELEWKHIGAHGDRPASIIELTVTDFWGGCKISEDVTDLKGNISPDLIDSLRQLADDLEEQNQKVANQTDFN